MKGLDKLNFLTKEDVKLLENSERMYLQFASIQFEIVSYDNDKNEIVIKILQGENAGNKYLTASELIERGKEVFKMLLKDYKVHFRPITYNRLTLQNMTIEDVRNNLDRLGIKQKDLVKMLDIDKSSIARLLSVNSCLTKYQKALFYYFFKCLETNEK